jgi:hypothetical protein
MKVGKNDGAEVVGSSDNAAGVVDGVRDGKPDGGGLNIVGVAVPAIGQTVLKGACTSTFIVVVTEDQNRNRKRQN